MSVSYTVCVSYFLVFRTHVTRLLVSFLAICRWRVVTRWLEFLARREQLTYRSDQPRLIIYKYIFQRNALLLIYMAYSSSSCCQVEAVI